MTNNQKPKILIVDDDRAVCTGISLLLKKRNYQTNTANHPSEVIETINNFQPTLILLDMNFTIDTSGKQGLTLLKKIREEYPTISVILMTGWATVQLAVKGMKLGAKDFVAKPWDNKELVKSIESILHIYKEDSSNTTFSRSENSQGENNSQIIGSDPLLFDVLDMAARVAKTDASVLILGDSGTGKELLAEEIHRMSLRNNKPFVKVNLGGISSSLFESEMFGHKKGSFTDAYNDRQGRFSMADTGSIFLDEIGELALENQVKLLRVLQEKSFEVLGDSRAQRSDFRVICATNKDLSQLVNAGNFREDLFYRINLITLYLPSLQQRKSDIPELTKYFAQKVCELYSKDQPIISDETLSWISNQTFPGNIRELKNQVERTILLNFEKKEISIQDFKETRSLSSNPNQKIKMPNVGSISLDKMEESMIKHALDYHQHNISKAARSLGITRSSLYRRLEKYNIPYEPKN